MTRNTRGTIPNVINLRDFAVGILQHLLRFGVRTNKAEFVCLRLTVAFRRNFTSISIDQQELYFIS